MSRPRATRPEFEKNHEAAYEFRSGCHTPFRRLSHLGHFGQQTLQMDSLLNWNHAVEKSVNHGWTRMDTDKNGIQTKKQLTALISRRGAEAQRRERRKKKTSSFLVPDFLLTSPLRPRTSRLSVVSNESFRF
jgi:hypothetical protein